MTDVDQTDNMNRTSFGLSELITAVTNNMRFGAMMDIYRLILRYITTSSAIEVNLQDCHRDNTVVTLKVLLIVILESNIKRTICDHHYLQKSNVLE